MNRIFLALLPLIAGIISQACSNSELDKEGHMVFGDVVYVTEFPNEYTLSSEVETGIDVIGAWDFIIQDTMIILSTRNKNGL